MSRRISDTGQTIMAKRFLPTAFAFLLCSFSFYIAYDSFYGLGNWWREIFPAAGFLAIMLFYKLSVIPVLDRLDDYGDHLVARRGPISVQIPLADISNIEFVFVGVRGSFAKLSTYSESELGRLMKFYPRRRFRDLFRWSAKNSVIDDLRQRVAGQRLMQTEKAKGLEKKYL